MGLSAAGAGAHRTGPVGTAARGCALAPGGEAAEGGTGGIRSLQGNSCTDSGGWAGEQGGGGGERGGNPQGGGEGRGEGARDRGARGRAHALSRTPSTARGSSLLRSSLPGSARSPALSACGSPAAVRPALSRREGRTSSASTPSPAEALSGPSVDLVR